MTTSQFSFGIATLIVFAITIRRVERQWLTPTAVFVAFFGSAILFAPWHRIRFTTLQGYNLDFFPLATRYSLAALWAVWAGFLVAPRPKHDPKPLSPLLSDGAYHLLRAFLIALFAVRVWAMIKSGSFFEEKGAGTYSSGYVRWISHCTTLIYPIFLLILADVFVRRWRGLNSNTVYLFLISAFVIIINMATFSRHGFIWVGLYFFLFYHSRKGLTRHQLAACAMIVVMVCIAAGLRTLGTGIANASTSDITSVVMQSASDVDRTASAVLASVAGQEVFTNVLGYVPYSEGYSYGATYWNSAVGLLTPRFLTGRFEESAIATPAAWYKNWYAPTTTGHGFDFSMLAESYMNFGQGMIVFFGIVGMLVGYLSHSIRKSSSTLHVCICIVALTALCFGLRNDSNTILKATVYFSIFFWGIAKFSRMKSRASHRRTPRNRTRPLVAQPPSKTTPPAPDPAIPVLRPVRRRRASRTSAQAGPPLRRSSH